MTTIRKILSTLSPSEDAKGAFMKALKNKGVKLDSFPLTRLSVETVAEGLTRAEDVLELQRGTLAAGVRAALKPMRRELENRLDA